MKWIVFIFSLAFSYLLGFTLNKGLSSTNTIINLNNKKKILNYDIPFIYTVGLNEIIFIISITVLFFLCLHYFYFDSETSRLQLFKLLLKSLWIEIIIFGFIMGSWGSKIINESIENNFFVVHEWGLVFFMLTFIEFIYLFQDNANIENKIEKNFENDLYPSREKMLKLIDFNLKTCKGFSIIGDWGIGKTKLIENYFYNNMQKNINNEYELIYIDVSSFSENKKIIEIIEYEINKILKKYKILKMDEKLVEKLFEESNGIMKCSKALVHKKENISDSKKMIIKKILELKRIKNKKIVICLDNIERISDMNRIINLLAIVDDLTSNNIIKLYVYDKNYMEKIFDKINFKEFIDKYSEIELELKEVDISEIIEKIELSLPENHGFGLELRIEVLKINLDLSDDDFIRIYNINIEEEIEEKFKNIINKNKIRLEKTIKKLSNSRYIHQVLLFVKNNAFEYDILYKLDYKIWKDNFNDLGFENNLIQEIFFSNLSPYDERKKREVFKALDNLEYKIEKYEVDKDKESLLNNAKLGEGENIINYIDFCIESGEIEDIKDYFLLNLEYKIKNFKELESFYIYYIKYNLDLNNIKINYNKNFLLLMETYGVEMDEKIVKVLFLRNRLNNIKLISRFLLNDIDDYEKLYVVAPLKFEDELNYFGYSSLDNFIMKIREKYNEIRTDVEFMEELEVDKNKIFKEFEFFEKIKLYKQKDNKEWSSKIKAETLLELSRVKVKFNTYFKVSDEKILVKINILDEKVDEEINSQNISNYKKYLKELNIDKNNYLLQILKREVIILAKKLNKNI